MARPVGATRVTGAADWRGRVGDTWAAEHARTERAFAGIAAALDKEIGHHAPVRGRAADLGCGVGSTALALAAARPGLRVTGIDLSPALVAVARDRAGAAGPAFVAGDVVEVLPALAPLDLLVSRHGVMFFADPRAGFSALRRAVVPGGALVFSCFRERAANDWVVEVERVLELEQAPAAAPGYAPGPFALGNRVLLEAVLADAGWRDVAVRACDVDYVVGGGAAPVADALSFYRRIGPVAALLAAADTVTRARYEARLRDLFARRIHGGSVTFSAAIWIVSARRRKEVS